MQYFSQIDTAPNSNENTRNPYDDNSERSREKNSMRMKKLVPILSIFQIFFIYPIICYVEFDWFGKSVRVQSLCRAYTGLLV